MKLFLIALLTPVLSFFGLSVQPAQNVVTTTRVDVAKVIIAEDITQSDLLQQDDKVEIILAEKNKKVRKKVVEKPDKVEIKSSFSVRPESTSTNKPKEIIKVEVIKKRNPPYTPHKLITVRSSKNVFDYIDNNEIIDFVIPVKNTLFNKVLKVYKKDMASVKSIQSKMDTDFTNEYEIVQIKSEYEKELQELLRKNDELKAGIDDALYKFGGHRFQSSNSESSKKAERLAGEQRLAELKSRYDYKISSAKQRLEKYNENLRSMYKNGMDADLALMNKMLLGPLMFKGYICTDDCSGHEAGYGWAEDKEIDDQDDCSTRSESFNEGCMAYVYDSHYYR